jgi:putative transcriptional regulator
VIHCKLLEVMGRRGIRFVARLSEETGINRRTLALLAENRMARYDADVLARLCSYLECDVGDLLEFRPMEATELAEVRS